MPAHLRWGWLPLVLLALWLATGTARAADDPGLYRVYFDGRDDLTALAGELDVWEVDHAGGYLIAALTPAQAAAVATGHRIAPASSPDWTVIQSAHAAGGITGFACYRTVTETYARLTQLAGQYPALVRAVDIGDTWDKITPGGPAGLDLRVLVITNRATTGPKPRFFLMAGIHARELATSETALRFAEQMLAGYGRDADATWLLDHAELHVLVAANPDGRLIAEQGTLWRKNTNSADNCPYNYPPNASYGVDLNRNFAYAWDSCGFGCSSGFACDQTYRGSSAASEPETQAIQHYLSSIYPDARPEDGPAPADTPGLLISLHSYGRLVLYPWGHTDTPAPNATGMAALAERLGDILGYRACQAGGVGCLYPTDGSTDDWSYGELGIASYTIEMGTQFFQSCEIYEGALVEPALAALTYAFRVAVVPYRQPRGPHIAGLAAPSAIAAGDAFSLSLRLDAPADTVRLTFGEPPWLPAARPVDYPAPEPDAAGLITLTVTHATGGLPAGRTLLFAQAQLSPALAGPAVAQFITVTRASPFGVTLAPAEQTVYTGDPARYTVALTNTSAVTASYVVSVTSGWPAQIELCKPIVLGPHRSVTAGLTITAPRGTAGAVAPAVVSACLIGEVPDCIQLVTVTTARARRTILPIISLERAIPDAKP